MENVVVNAPAFESVQAIEQEIQGTVSNIQVNQENLKKKNEEFKMILESREDYQAALSLVSKAAKEKKTAREEAFKAHPELSEIRERIKTIRASIKVEQATMSERLVSYRKKTNQDQIPLFGDLVDIEVVAKVKIG